MIKNILLNKFTWCFFLATFLLGYVLFGSDKLILHLGIIHYHSNFKDVVMPYLTHLGDGIFASVLIILYLLFFSVRSGIGLFIAFALSGIVAQLLKRNFFNGEMRPFHYFREHGDFHFVDGVKLHLEHSFPSGHATCAFAMFAFLAFRSNNGFIQILLFLAAALAAYSRVYLSQHFVADVFAGMWIGTL
ncbi:MAG TPA: phosphatase PAP2 family protein, partial [Flavobacteriales bacterium]|nr:phosphatase PAP2 family protein [Flavobacteriales bacterium]